MPQGTQLGNSKAWSGHCLWTLKLKITNPLKYGMDRSRTKVLSKEA